MSGPLSKQKLKEMLLGFQTDPAAFVERILRVVPTDQQRELLDAVASPGSRVTVKSGHGCFGKGTRVMLARGDSIEVQNVKVGDKLMGVDGKPVEVLDLCSGEEKMYEIEYSDRTKYVVNGSHLLCLKKHPYKGVRKELRVPLKEFMKFTPYAKTAWFAWRTGVESPDPPLSLPLPARLLGIWLGDGTETRPVITTADPEIVTYLGQMSVMFGCSLEHRGGLSYAFRGIRRNNGILKGLRAAKVLGKKHIPELYFSASREDRMRLLGGLIDSDGHWDKSNGRQYVIQQKREGLARDIQRLARSLGMHACVREMRNRSGWKGEFNTYWVVGITRGCVEDIPLLIARKRIVSDKPFPRKDLCFSIRKVVSLGVDKYYGFTLGGDGRFLGADFSVLSNTGKSCVLAWIILWFVCCFDDCKVPCTAPSSHQLKDVLWSEISKWHAGMEPWFKEQVIVRGDKIRIEGANNRFAVARTSRKEAPEALQGFHATNLLFVVDEASGVPEQIFESARGALSTVGARIVMTANPTRNDGYFHSSHHKNRNAWTRLTFSCLDSSLVSQQYIEEMREEYGEESDVFRVRVLGEFPEAGIVQLIPRVLAELASRRKLHVSQYSFAPGVLGVDVAWEGDDRSTIVYRQGLHSRILACYHKLDNMTLAGRVAQFQEELGTSATFVDMGMGTGVIDRLRQMGHRPIPVAFGGKSGSDRFTNKRTEMWWGLRDCLQPGGQIPDEKDLIADLVGPEYAFSPSGKIQLERKKDMKKRGLPSPDLGDGLALTFAAKVHVEESILNRKTGFSSITEYDVLAFDRDNEEFII